MPGVPDFYQGTESWDLSLVDPDNRRPVDFAARADMLAALEAPDWDALAQSWRDGRLKFAWTRHLLRLRNELPEVFSSGGYQPLTVSGPHRDHVIAFARRHGREAVVVAVAKSFAPFTQGGRSWPRPEAFEGEIDVAGYALPGGDSRIQLSTLFAKLPVAVLKAKAAAGAKQASSSRARAHG